MKIANDTMNLVKIDFQADADLGVITLPELKAIIGIIDAVEQKLVNQADLVGLCNPERDDGVLKIEFPRAVVDPYFEKSNICLRRTWQVNEDGEGEPGDWTISESRRK